MTGKWQTWCSLAHRHPHIQACCIRWFVGAGALDEEDEDGDFDTSSESAASPRARLSGSSQISGAGQQASCNAEDASTSSLAVSGILDDDLATIAAMCSELSSVERSDMNEPDGGSEGRETAPQPGEVCLNWLHLF